MNFMRYFFVPKVSRVLQGLIWFSRDVLGFHSFFNVFRVLYDLFNSFRNFL